MTKCYKKFRSNLEKTKNKYCTKIITFGNSLNSIPVKKDVVFTKQLTDIDRLSDFPLYIDIDVTAKMPQREC